MEIHGIDFSTLDKKLSTRGQEFGENKEFYPKIEQRLGQDFIRNPRIAKETQSVSHSNS